MPPPLLAAWPPPVRTPATSAGASCPSPSARGFRAAPPLCANGECREPKRYAPPPHFSPHAPTLSLTGQRAQDPPPLSLPAPVLCTNGGIVRTSTGHGQPALGTTPRPLASCSRTRAERGLGYHPPPLLPFAQSGRRIGSPREPAPCPLLPPSCPREWGVEKAAPNSGHGPEEAWANGAIEGAARVGTGTQAARQAPLPPYACGVHAGMPPTPTPLLPCPCDGDAQNPGLRTEGAQVKRRPSRTACEHDPARRLTCTTPAPPPFACRARVVPHAGRRAKGGMRKVGRAGVVHAGRRAGSCSHPFPALRHLPLLIRPRLLRMHHPQPLRAPRPLHPTQAGTQEGEAPLLCLRVHPAVPPLSAQGFGSRTCARRGAEAVGSGDGTRAEGTAAAMAARPCRVRVRCMRRRAAQMLPPPRFST